MTTIPTTPLDATLPGALTPPSATAPAATRPPRLDSVDLLRGVVMIIMALDHVRDFFSSARFDPTDLTQTTTALFYTRWITHFCAPVFVLLAGTGAYLSLGRGRSKADLSRFLLTRGLWLALLEITVIKLAFQSIDYTVTGGYILQVIWALGWSMVALAALIHLPMRALVLVSAIMIAGHNLLDGIAPEAFGAFAWLWPLLHVPTATAGEPGGAQVVVIYPLIPWIGVMALGYALGALLGREDLRFDATKRRRTLIALGTALTVGFVALRFANIYGDSSRWAMQKTSIFTLLSFLNTTKYPPSLLFLLMTLGPALIALALCEHWQGRSATFVRIFGRVPLFYYVMHAVLISNLAVAIWIYLERTGRQPTPETGGWGLPVVYLIWFGIVAALYPLCRWFAEVKARRRDAWLSYL